MRSSTQTWIWSSIFRVACVVLPTLCTLCCQDLHSRCLRSCQPRRTSRSPVVEKDRERHAPSTIPREFLAKELTWVTSLHCDGSIKHFHSGFATSRKWTAPYVVQRIAGTVPDSLKILHRADIMHGGMLRSAFCCYSQLSKLKIFVSQ